MTKSIEDELNLPRLEDALKEQSSNQDDSSENHQQIEAIAAGLQNIKPGDLENVDPSGLDIHISEADDIYEQAMKAHKDLLDLGFNIEPKHAGANAFTPSAKMLEIALKASQSKTIKKMEKIRLMLEQEAHRREMNDGVEDGEIIDSKNSILANRNDIMEKLRKGEI